MAPPNHRKLVIRSCKARGLTVHPDVLPILESHVDELSIILDQLKLMPSISNSITPKIWQDFLKTASAEPSNQRKTTGIEVVSAFKTPKLVYDLRRKQYQVSEKQGPVLGSAEDKVNMLMNRYQLIHQRVLRNDLFRPKSLHERPMQLTPVASLLGGKNNRSALSLLLGVLVRTSETEFALEDPTGQVALDFSNATISDGSVIVEHSILLVEGTFEDQVLFIHRLGQPVPESREQSLKALEPQLSHPHFAMPKTLPATVAVLYGTSNIDKVISKSHPDVLVVLLSRQDDSSSIPTDSAIGTKLVIVPPCQTAVWPMPPLSAKTTSNPCRIRVPHEIVVWNAPMRQLWNEQSLRLGDQKHWITTPLHQGTLVPPATTPVHWNYSHAMALYPVPDALVVVGTDTEVRSHGDCEILQMQQEDGACYAIFDEDGWHLSSFEH